MNWNEEFKDGADGELGYELALFVQRQPPRIRFMTGALAGLLLTARIPMVDANQLLRTQHIGQVPGVHPEIESNVRSYQ